MNSVIYSFFESSNHIKIPEPLLPWKPNPLTLGEVDLPYYSNPRAYFIAWFILKWKRVNKIHVRNGYPPRIHQSHRDRIWAAFHILAAFHLPNRAQMGYEIPSAIDSNLKCGPNAVSAWLMSPRQGIVSRTLASDSVRNSPHDGRCTTYCTTWWVLRFG